MAAPRTRHFRSTLPLSLAAEKALAWIGALYDIDERAAGDVGRLAELRRAESAVVLEE